MMPAIVLKCFPRKRMAVGGEKFRIRWEEWTWFSTTMGNCTIFEAIVGSLVWLSRPEGSLLVGSSMLRLHLRTFSWSMHSIRRSGCRSSANCHCALASCSRFSFNCLNLRWIDQSQWRLELLSLSCSGKTVMNISKTGTQNGKTGMQNGKTGTHISKMGTHSGKTGIHFTASLYKPRKMGKREFNLR